MSVAQICWTVVGVLTAFSGFFIGGLFLNIRRSERGDDREAVGPVLPPRPFDFDAQEWDHVDLRNPNSVIEEIERIVIGERAAWLDRVEQVKGLLKAYRQYQSEQQSRMMQLPGFS